MSKQPDGYEDLISRLSKASMELKETIREAHQASRDLKAQTRDAKEALSNKPVEALLSALLAQQIQNMNEDVIEHTHKVYDKVTQEFDKLTKPLMESIDEIHEHLKTLDVEIIQRQKIVREL
jgi:predicted transcriptional regulator